MPNVYLGTTPISVGELGTTNVTKIYLGDTQVWPSGILGKLFIDDYNTDTLGNYTVFGNEMAVTGGALAVSGSNDGFRTVLRNSDMVMDTDDVLLRFKSVQAVQGRQNGLVLRANNIQGSAGERWIAINWQTGNVWLQRVHKDTGVVADFTSAGSLTTSQLNAGGTMEFSAIGNHYVATAITSTGTRVTKIDYTDAANIVQTGPSNRQIGLRFQRLSLANSASCDELLAYDTSVYPVHVGLNKSATQATAALGTYQRVTGWVARDGWACNALPSTNIITMSGAGTVSIDARVQMTSGTSRTMSARLVKNGSTVVWESSTTTSGTLSIAMPQQTGVSVVAGDYFELQHRLVSGSATTIAAGSAATYLYATPTDDGV